MKFGLNKYTRDLINSVFKEYPEVNRVLIYGSRAKGNYREGSDIDLTMVGTEISNELLSQISNELYDLHTPYLFDVSLYDKIDSHGLKEQIERVGKVFYEKEKLLTAEVGK